MRAVVSIGGSIIVDAVENDTLDEYANVFEQLAEELETLVIVTGAGHLKKYIEAVPDTVSEARKDLIGIKATQLQASTLAAALGANVGVPESLEEVAHLERTHDVIVLGGLLPGQSTDGVAAECAEIIGADRLAIATTIDGVYERDPTTHTDAEKLDELGYEDLLDIIRDQESTAGSYALMDLTAAKLVQRSELETVVLDGENLSALSDALGDDHGGTTIR